jgi:hypothetical protein
MYLYSHAVWLSEIVTSVTAGELTSHTNKHRATYTTTNTPQRRDGLKKEYISNNIALMSE